MAKGWLFKKPKLTSMLPPNILLDPMLESWLREDIGRGDRTTTGLFPLGNAPDGEAILIAKAPGVVSGLPIAARVFQLLDPAIKFTVLVADGNDCTKGQKLAEIKGSLATLLMGERVALNLVMRMSGISTMTKQYLAAIADLSATLVDTRKTTPGLRLLEKYATQIAGATNHRYGLDDAVMIKDNHIAAAGSITAAVNQIRKATSLTTIIEVETEAIAQVEEAINMQVQIIMLDNMPIALMKSAIALIRNRAPQIKIEASGNITLDTIRSVAELGMDYISTSAMVTRSPWLDLSLNIHSS